MCAEGMPLRAVLSDFSARGLARPDGRPFTLPTLWRFLRDPACAGLPPKPRRKASRKACVSVRLYDVSPHSKPCEGKEA